MLHNFCGQTENEHNFFNLKIFSRVRFLKPQDPSDLNRKVKLNHPTAHPCTSLKNSLLVQGVWFPLS